MRSLLPLLNRILAKKDVFVSILNERDLEVGDSPTILPVRISSPIISAAAEGMEVFVERRRRPVMARQELRLLLHILAMFFLEMNERALDW